MNKLQNQNRELFFRTIRSLMLLKRKVPPDFYLIRKNKLCFYTDNQFLLVLIFSHLGYWFAESCIIYVVNQYIE